MNSDKSALYKALTQSLDYSLPQFQCSVFISYGYIQKFITNVEFYTKCYCYIAELLMYNYRRILISPRSTKHLLACLSLAFKKKW